MKTFCFCFPVRAGVFLLSILTLGISGLLAAYGWKSFIAQKELLETGVKVAVVLANVSWSLLAIFSLFGFIGACAASLPFVSAYSQMLFWQWFIDLGLTIAYIAVTFKDLKHKFIEKCTTTDGNFLDAVFKDLKKSVDDAVAGKESDPLAVKADAVADPAKQEACESGFKLFVGIAVTVLVLYKLLALYGCVIAHRYVRQLREERTEDRWSSVEKRVDRHDLRIPPPPQQHV